MGVALTLAEIIALSFRISEALRNIAMPNGKKLRECDVEYLDEVFAAYEARLGSGALGQPLMDAIMKAIH